MVVDMKFEDLVAYAQTIPQPDFSNIKEKENIHYICESTYITLHNESQIKTMLITLEMCPPMKIVVKKMLNMYLEKCDPNYVKQKTLF
jgi:hypothetical protein